MMGRGLYAKLSPAMIEEADTVGRKRQANAEKIGATPGYGLEETPEEALDRNIWGTRCERAGKVIFPSLPWNAYRDKFDFRGLADLGDWIEIKGVGEDRLNLVVPVKALNPDRAYLLISRENHPYYWIAGWMWGREVATHEIRFKRPAYFVWTARLHKPYLLQAMVRREEK